MAYITLEYYKTDFLGNDPGDDTELERYIARASDAVDLVTDFVITDFDELTEFQQKCVQKATAAFTEFWVENGDSYNEMAGSEATGGWSKSSSVVGDPRMLSKTGIAWLNRSGLIDRTVRVGGHIYAEATE